MTKYKRSRPPGRDVSKIVKLLDALNEFPGLTIVEMAKHLGWNRNTARYYLWHGQRDGDVRKELTARGKNGRYRRYRYYLRPLEELEE